MGDNICGDCGGVGWHHCTGKPIQKTGINEQGELTKKKKKEPIKIHDVPEDVDLSKVETLEEENEKLTKENEFLERKLEILQQQNSELIQEMEMIKSDFETRGMR